ncbi:ABC transporter substrate-binding protein [Ectopseudomonas oleovorans]|nr:ABC transporter substrate-binding protein [Pseudomonas oleovorans]
MLRMLLCLFAVLLAQSGTAGPLRVAMEGQFPPFEELDAQGNLVGFNVDIARALCQRMQRECELQRFAWDDLIPALDAGRADLILASMSITAARAERVDFTARYAQTPAFFFARKGHINQMLITPRRIAGKRVGVQQGTTYERFLEARFAEHVQLLRYPSAAQAYLALAGGELDLVLDDAVSGYFGFLLTELGRDFEQVGGPVVAPQFFGQGQGIAVRKGDDELRQQLDRALAAILADGTHKRIEKRYFKQFSVY